jgi:hypothetical protein
MASTASVIPTYVWLALFPLTYLLHFAEEYWCDEGYPAYLRRLRGIEISETRFVVFEMLGLVLIVIGVVVSLQFGFPEFMIVLLGGVVLANGLSHTATAIWAGGYGPGLVISAVVWLPLGIVSLVMMFGRMPNIRFAIAASIGIAINVAVGVIAMRGGKIKRATV